MNPIPPNLESPDPLKEATLDALSQVLEPLLHLMMETGVTVREVTEVLRTRAVLCALDRVRSGPAQQSQSRIAIMTGLPRSVVAATLKSASRRRPKDSAQHPTRKVLAGWFDDHGFLDKQGAPLTLPIFGKGKTFEKLVTKYGSGIPVRAMLDELMRIGAIEIQTGQRVSPRQRLPVATGLTRDSIVAIGARGRDLLRTLTNNALKNGHPLFEAAATTEKLGLNSMALLRRDLQQQGTSFINAADALLKQATSNSTSSATSTVDECRIGVAIYCFEEARTKSGNFSNTPRVPRKNLRRA